MTKREFASMLAEEVTKTGMDAEVDDIFRADGTYVAVILKKDDGAPVPRIPIDGFHEAFEGGVPLEKVKADFVEQARLANEMALDVHENVAGWTWTKERVILRLVPADRKEYLAGCVHRKAADLAVVCSVLISDEAATTVTPSLLKAWKVTEEELFQTAAGNTDPVVSGIGDFMGLTGGEGAATMTVLTNRLGRFGAGAVLCNGIQEQLDAIYPEGSYLLPSSIHEWIAVGKDNTPDDLKQMVKDINRTVLCPQDILSDNIYTLEGGVLKVVC